MEIYAAIKGLQLLKKPCKVRLYSDLQYLVKAMSEEWVTPWKKRDWWRTNKERAVNVDLWQRLLELSVGRRRFAIMRSPSSANPDVAAALTG